MRRNVLVIAYYFPPLGGGGVQRTTKFVRYLSEFGWHPVVLSVKNPAYGAYDTALLSDIPADVPIYRAYALQPTALYFRQKRAAVLTSDQAPHSSGVAATLKRAVRVVGRGVFAFTLFPDDKIGWVPFAIREASAILEKHPIDLIYSTSAPYSAHIIADRVARAARLPWVADFRDPFVGYETIPAPSPLHRRARQRLERHWVTAAKRVISVTPIMTRDFARRYPDIAAEKWRTILNGYDHKDFEDVPPYEAADTFDIRYVGTLHRSVSPDPTPLLHALHDVLSQDPGARQVLRLSFTGQIDATMLQLLQQAVARWNLGDIVSVHPPVTHDDAIRLMTTATVLLAMLDTKSGTELAIPAKCFEYLPAKRPILALSASRGITYDLLHTMDGMHFIDPDDWQQINAQINTWLAQWRLGTLPAPQNVGHQQFSRRQAAAQLADIFQEVVSEVAISKDTA